MIKFESITERDIDFLIMRAFSTLSSVAVLFFDRAHWHSDRILSIEHSRSDIELGESDITVVFEQNGRKFALLIEDKINAEEMPEQYKRYTQRGDKGVANNEYSEYKVFMSAPSKYLSALPAYDGYLQISFEEMLDTCRRSGQEFDAAVLDSALYRSSNPYMVQEVPQITRFWHDMYDYVHRSECHTDMFEVKTPKGSRSGWFMFKSLLPKTFLYFKSDRGYVDLEFSKKAYGDCLPCLIPESDLPSGIHWAKTGESWSLRIRVDTVDIWSTVAVQAEAIDTALNAVSRLYDYSKSILGHQQKI